MASQIRITCNGPNGVVVNGTTTLQPGQTMEFPVHNTVQLTVDDAVSPSVTPAWAAVLDGKLDTIITQTAP